MKTPQIQCYLNVSLVSFGAKATIAVLVEDHH